MLDTPEIAQTDELLTAVIAIEVPRSGIQGAMMPALQEMRSTLAEQGIAIAGPWLSHHLHLSADIFDFEVTFPVASAVSPSGRVQPGRLRACRVARTIYRGPYEGLGSAWAEFRVWVSAQGLMPAEDLWERYLSGPEASSDPQQWQTELVQPLA